jgi:hypothetical protein
MIRFACYKIKPWQADAGLPKPPKLTNVMLLLDCFALAMADGQ